MPSQIASSSSSGASTATSDQTPRSATPGCPPGQQTAHFSSIPLCHAKTWVELLQRRDMCAGDHVAGRGSSQRSRACLRNTHTPLAYFSYRFSSSRWSSRLSRSPLPAVAMGATESGSARRSRRLRRSPVRSSGSIGRYGSASTGSAWRGSGVSAREQRERREAFATLPGGVSQATLDAIGACESGGDPTAVSSDGSYRGKYQFDYGTWASVGGTGDPAAASEAEQDYRAALLYARSGSSPWPVCG